MRLPLPEDTQKTTPHQHLQLLQRQQLHLLLLLLPLAVAAHSLLGTTTSGTDDAAGFAESVVSRAVFTFAGSASNPLGVSEGLADGCPSIACDASEMVFV